MVDGTKRDERAEENTGLRERKKQEKYRNQKLRSKERLKQQQNDM